MKSLDVTKDLVNYSVAIQTLFSLLESCSSTLESIDASNRSLTSLLLWAISDFVYPKLERLDIAVTDYAQTRKLVSQCRNVRSIILHLDSGHGQLAWLGGITFEKLENLEVQFLDDSTEYVIKYDVNVSPLIGNVPNLKFLTIKSVFADVILHMQEFSQLLASVPRLEVLNLESQSGVRGQHNDLRRPNSIAALTTWRHPKLSTLTIDFCRYPKPIPSSLLEISASFPKLKSFSSHLMEGINDQGIMALSRIEQLQELDLPNLELTKDEFIRMITLLQSLAILKIRCVYKISEIDDQVLAQMKNLRELSIWSDMTNDEVTTVITASPSVAILQIEDIRQRYAAPSGEFFEFGLT